ncbi:MAG: hypothetical protein M1831_007165 [Alyxoria varia]|nr:MAG: hypothetical protein M1831_007165 [Alyxoria varia]
MSRSKSHNKTSHSSNDSLDEAASITHDTDLIERPAPLDRKTERELKAACAVVLQDLKPSGYDIEDNRMKSDVLVDDASTRHADIFTPAQATSEPPRPAPIPQIREPRRPPKPKRDKSHSSAAWIISNDEEDDNMVFPHSLTKESESQQLSRETTNSDALTAKPKPTSSKPDDQSLAPRLQPKEHPLAPVSTTVNESRQELASPPKRVASPPIHSAEYSDTNASSSLGASTDHTKPASSAPSATPFTPSQHVSRHGSGNVYSHPTFSEDEEWMRKGVERHRQAQESASQSNQISPELQNVSSYTRHSSPRAAPADRPASRNRLRGISSENSPQIFQDASSRRESQLRVESWSSTKSSPTNPRFFVQPHSSNTKGSRPGSARSMREDNLVKDTPASPVINYDSPDIPPVPRLDTERKSQLSSRTLSPAPPQRRFDGEQSAKILEQKLSNLRDKTDEPLASPRSREFGPSSQSKQTAPASETKSHSFHTNPVPLSKYSSPPQITSLSDKQSSVQDNSARPGSTAPVSSTSDPFIHQQDPSVFVRDFYQPSDRTRGSGPSTRDRQVPKRSMSSERDPNSALADFDSLMSVVHAPAGEESRFSYKSRSTLHISDANGSRTSPGVSSERSQASGFSATAPQLTEVSPVSPAAAPGQPLASSKNADRVSNSSLPAFSVSNATPPDLIKDKPTKSPPPMSPTGRPSASSVQPESQTDSNVQHQNRSSTTSGRMSQAASPASRDSTSSGQQHANGTKGRIRSIPKFFHKLGGGDMPVRQKMYVPGAREEGETKEKEQIRTQSLRGGSASADATNSANGITSKGTAGDGGSRTTTILENRGDKVNAPYAGMTGAYGGSLMYGIGMDGETGGDEDDSDYDPHACEAPVIGFGRGW